MTTFRAVHLWCGLAVSALALTLAPLQAQNGSALPAWRAGELDIHHIATGRGNATFFVFPDGTTLLVDAGAVVSDLPYADPLPDRSKTAGAWIVDYIRHFHPAGTGARLDYALVTHFHADHMGELAPSNARDADGNELTGITEVMASLHPAVVVDRGWPSYDYPTPLIAAPTPESRVVPGILENYTKVLRRDVARGAVRAERAVVGSASEIRMKGDGGATPFEMRVVTANGAMWSGDGDSAVPIFPPLDEIPASDLPDENMCSIGLRLRYGRFDYFTGGDLPGDPEGAPAWQGVETRLGPLLGPTDVHQVNHHGSIDPATPGFLAALRSRVLIVPAWAPTHPSPDALKRMLNQRYYQGPRDVFTLALREPMKHAIGARVGQLAADHGHVVVRVAPGGATYSVFVLDDRTPARAVLKTFGPYPST